MWIKYYRNGKKYAESQMEKHIEKALGNKRILGGVEGTQVIC